MTTSAVLLPNGRKQFLSATGAPLAGGFVYYYVPSTTTFKQTWQDSGQATQNTNPIILDAAGSAVVYGSGVYREYVTDSIGNLVSDAVTTGVLISDAMVSVVGASTAALALSTMGGFGSIANVAALRAATVSTLPASECLLLGYATGADNGGGVFWYNSTDTTSADNGGTIFVDASGRRWYRNFTGTTLNIEWFGGSTAATDNTASLNAALATLASPGGRITFPAGKFSFTNGISYSPPGTVFSLTITGSGADSTELTWTTTSGIAFNATQPQHTIHLADMTISSGAVGTSVGLALNQTIPQYIFGQSDITRVTFRGADAVNLTNYWLTSVTISGFGNLNFDGCLFYGHPVSTTSSLGTGVAIVGLASGANPYGIVYNFVNCSFWELSICINYGNHVQGVAISNCNFTNSNIGVTNPTGSTGGSQLAVSNSQFNVFNNCIFIGGVLNNLLVSNNLMFIALSNANGIGVSGGVSAYCNITGNQLAGVNGATNTNGIYVTGTFPWGLVTGNTFVNLTTGVDLNAGTSLWNVQSNIYAGCTNTVVNSGSGNTIGGGSA